MTAPTLLTPWHDLDRLARAAAATASARWYFAYELAGDTDYPEDAEYIAACSPERILSLLDAATRGAEDTARLEWLEERGHRRCPRRPSRSGWTSRAGVSAYTA